MTDTATTFAMENTRHTSNVTAPKATVACLSTTSSAASSSSLPAASSLCAFPTNSNCIRATAAATAAATATNTTTANKTGNSNSVLTCTTPATIAAISAARAVHPPVANSNNNNKSQNDVSMDSSLRHLAHRHHHHHLHLPPPPHSVKRACRIGILLHNVKLMDRASRVLDHSISFCKFSALCLLHVPSDGDDNNNKNNSDNRADPDTACRNWLRHLEDTTPGYGHHADSSAVTLYTGEQGLANMLTDDDLDAVYVIVPTECQRQYVLQCLRSTKHVLIKDLRSTALREFREQVATARAHQRFVQFSTMFDIQYNVQAFLATVNHNDCFGRIQHVKAELDIGDADLPLVGARWPLRSDDSCIHTLARYCLLMALLMTPAEEQARPLQAQIDHCLRNEDGVPINANGRVWFDNGRLLELRVGYSAVRTRQVLEVRAARKYAVLTEFAVPKEHGLHSFRVYECQDTPPTNGNKSSSSSSWDNVTAGEALDVPSGLPQHVMMWRGFAELCQSVQDVGWANAKDATFLTNTAVALKATLAALERSAAAQDYQAVPVVLE